MAAGAGSAADDGAEATTAVSSEPPPAAPSFRPRLSLILKSCFSSSNSEIEFFFIRSIMALMSFRSTVVLSLMSFQTPSLPRGFCKKSSNRTSALLRTPDSSRSEDSDFSELRQGACPEHGDSRTTVQKAAFCQFQAFEKAPVTLMDASRAKRYEFGPKPVICPLQTGAISDLCRNSSRAWILER